MDDYSVVYAIQARVVLDLWLWNQAKLSPCLRSDPIAEDALSAAHGATRAHWWSSRSRWGLPGSGGGRVHHRRLGVPGLLHASLFSSMPDPFLHLDSDSLPSLLEFFFITSFVCLLCSIFNKCTPTDSFI